MQRPRAADRQDRPVHHGPGPDGRGSDGLRAVLFDYGNTLIKFDRPQIEVCDRALGEALTRLFGPFDAERLLRLRERDRLAPYAGDPPRYRENDLPQLTRRAIRELFRVEPTDDQLRSILDVRFDVFVETTRVADEVPVLLERLADRYRLGLVSNYPDGRAIRASLERNGLLDRFESVVVSGDVGRVKPHPLPFQTALDELGLAPEECVYVGDNWLADVQGAKRLGMGAVWYQRWETPERFERSTDHLPADAEIDDLARLPELLEALGAPPVPHVPRGG